ncbi:MAG: M6 family metalloprotease domain-containing protein [Verrucomicrobia bacterium]|nr:M6 family metalloprotease domain-containing protein [Verrucomicrobiota bacterium]
MENQLRMMARRCFKNFRLVAMPLGAGLAMWTFDSALAVPANPQPREVTQPDGTKIQLRLRGDEFFSWHETIDGYVVAKDAADGFWKFAQPATGKAAFSALAGARVGLADPARLGLRKHALPEVKVLRALIEERRQALLGQPVELAVPEAPAGQPKTKPSGTHSPKIAVSGVKTIKNLVILACFSDHWDSGNNTVLPSYGRVDTNEYINLFNQVGYNADGAAGSVKDYYKEVSYGKLTLDSTITVWVQLPHDRAYYGEGEHGGHPGWLAADAVEAADAAGVDFSLLDSDGDGWVDCLDIIHSGYGEEATGDANDVWSVKGSMSNMVTKDRVKMFTYHTEPALRDSSGTGIERIGTICHETGHFFGLPDLYDYSGTIQGLGSWCLMSGGSWNGTSGTRPGHFSAWCKVFLGFAKTFPIHSKTGLSLPRVEDNAVVGMLRDGMSNDEYFLIENRATTGFDDSGDVFSGLLIYHVDQRSANNNLGAWPHPAVKIEEADGNNNLTETGDAWTSTSGLAGGWRDQTGNQSANAMLYQTDSLYNRSDNSASYSYNRLKNFSAAGSTMTFNAQSLKTDAPTQSALSSTPFTLAWAASSQATKYEVQEGSPATLTSFFDGAESAEDLHDNWYVAGKTLREVTNASHVGSACYTLLQPNYGAVQSLLLRKSFKVTTSTVVSFYVASRISAGNGFIKCELSNDGGNTWKTLSTDDGDIAPWASRSYNYTAINAAGISNGDTCLLRFVVDIEFVSYYSGFPGPGFALDDISITGTEIAGYGGWTTLSDIVTSPSYPIAAKTAGVYAYRVQTYANGAWQGYGAEGEITVRANQAPAWTVNPITGSEANAFVAYSGNLSSLATDEVNDVLTFSKVSGPAWLTIRADGTIAGTPQSGDAGANTFTVRVTDRAGAFADATLNISVNSPYANWRLNELAGPTISDSVASFHGTAVGSLVYGQAGAPSGGAGNYAITFNGSDTAVSVPALGLTTDTMTIVALLKASGTQNTDAGIFFCRSSTIAGFRFGGGNALRYSWNGNLYTSTLVVPNDEWTFVAVAVGPTGATVYLATSAGVSTWINTAPHDVRAFTGTSYIGYDSGGSTRRFNGTMDYVAICGTTLSASQISQLARTAMNHPPVASSLTLRAPKNGTATFSLGKYASDPDGDALTVTFSGFNHGGRATCANGIVTYTPATGYAGDETFAYTVADANGGTASGTVAATVPASANAANILSATYNGGSPATATIIFAGIPGATYRLEHTTDLSTWTQVGSNVVLPAIGQASAGRATVIQNPAPSSAFYRAVYVGGP